MSYKSYRGRRGRGDDRTHFRTSTRRLDSPRRHGTDMQGQQTEAVERRVVGFKQ